MKKLLFLFTIFLFAQNIYAQEKCEFPVNSAPTFFNLRLGMNGAEAKRAVGGKLNIKNKKEGTFFQNFIKDSPPPNLSGVRVIYLRFFDSKLYQIEIFYDNENANLENFVQDFSNKQNLPFDFWKIEYGIARLDCQSFKVEADNYLNPRIQLTDTAIFAEFEKSQKKEN